MRLSASLTSKGQITIPKSIRTFLHVDTGDRLNFLIDHENDCVHMYVQQDSPKCLACSGHGILPESNSSCFLCFSTGDVSSDFQPLHYIGKWREQYNVRVETSMLEDEKYTNGLYIPNVKVFSSLYTTNELQRVNDAILIYLFKQLVVKEKNILEQNELAYLKELLQTSLKTELKNIFRTKDE